MNALCRLLHSGLIRDEPDSERVLRHMLLVQVRVRGKERRAQPPRAACFLNHAHILTRQLHGRRKNSCCETKRGLRRR